MKYLGYLYKPILQTFDYRGRATRTEFWVWYAFMTAVSYFAANATSSAVLSIERMLPVPMQNMFSWLAAPFGSFLILAVPTWAIMNRRVRDAGVNVHILWWNLVPLLSFLAMSANFLFGFVALIASFVLLIMNAILMMLRTQVNTPAEERIYVAAAPRDSE